MSEHAAVIPSPLAGRRGALGMRPGPAADAIVGLGGISIYAGLAVVMMSAGPWDLPLAYFVFPPSGILFAMLFVFGRRFWVAAAIGAGFVTYISDGATQHIVITMVGNALEPLVALAVMSYLRFDRERVTTRNVTILWVAIALGALVSGAFGSFGVVLTTERTLSELPRVWSMWTMGHGLGTLLFGAPVALLRCKPAASDARRIESAIMMISLALVSQAAFSVSPGGSGSYPLQYLGYPFLIWAAMRLAPLYVALGNSVLSGTALVWTAMGVGPFYQGPAANSLAYGTVFSLATWLTTMLLAAIVAERAASDGERRRREGAYRAVVEQAAEGIFVLDPDGVCAEVNAAGCRLLGVESDQILGSRLSEFTFGLEPSKIEALVADLAPGSSVLTEWTLAMDGEARHLEASVKRYENGSSQLFMRDVSERRKLEEQLSQSQKMEAVGLLAGGIAHEFNNQLTVILGHGSAGLAAAAETADTTATFREIVHAAEKSADLTAQLLTLASKHPSEPRLADADELLGACEAMIRQVLGESVQYARSACDSDGGNPLVWVDPARFEQVILNLVINANDAMPAGGRLTIRTDISENPPCDGERSLVMIEVRDTGLGMDRSTADRVFEPFFTTKADHGRTGLGLSVSYGIVEEAGGRIEVDSRAGVGTAVRLLFPLADGTPARDREETSRSALGLQERILIIEDDDGVRGFLEIALPPLGYEFESTCDGESAIALVENAPRSFDLVLCDVVLPGITGPDAVGRIEAHQPGIRALFMSGYDQDRLAAAGRGAGRLLRKPFGVKALGDAIHTALKHELGSEATEAATQP